MNNNTLGHQAAGIPQHSHNVKRCVKRSVAKEPHWRISNEEARNLFEMGVFNATAYLLAASKNLRKSVSKTQRFKLIRNHP